jgi:membrane-associated phospholipid phosphatase
MLILGVVTEEVLVTTGTSRAARLLTCGTLLVLFAAWVKLIGVPTDPFLLFGWIWLATIAWNVQAPARSHLAFARDWWPPLLVLVGYLYSRGLSDEVGLFDVHITEPITADRWLGGGTLPTERLQAALCGDPCDIRSDPQWYDVVLGSIYFTHFVTGLTVALVLWLRNRDEWAKWMRRYLGLNILGLFVYITYPMAPPWMASEQGYLGDIPRLTSRGSRDLGLGGFHVDLANVGNPVAAMPSLHAGIAALVAMYAVQRLHSRARWLLLLYPVTMSFMLVYFGEHYLIDIIAGFAAAGLVMWVCDRWERSRRTLSAWPETPQTTRDAPAIPLVAPPAAPAGPAIQEGLAVRAGPAPVGPEAPAGPARDASGEPQPPATDPRFDEDSQGAAGHCS